MIKFIYFDLGKVVFDHHHIFAKVAAQFGKSEDLIMNEFVSYKGPLTSGALDPQIFWSQVCRDLAISDGAGFDFTGYWVNQYTPRPEVHKCINDLHGKSYKIGLLSNIYRGMWPLLLTRGIVPDIPYASLVLSCDAGYGKPDLRIYDMAEKKAGVRPEEILYTDDKAGNLEGARNRGWNTLLFDTAEPAQAVSALYTFLNSA